MVEKFLFSFVVETIIEYFLRCVNKNVEKVHCGGDKLLYDRIREICKKKGVSVSALERQAGLGHGTISKWNNVSPTTDNLQAVANILKVKVDNLLK